MRASSMRRSSASRPAIPTASAGRPRTDTRSNVARDYVLDCSGRAGVIARHGLRRTDAPYRTLAIVAEWECDDWPPSEHTLHHDRKLPRRLGVVGAALATRRQCTVMIEARSTRPATPRSASVLHERELAKSTALRARLANARRVSAPWTCDASIYDCVRAADGPRRFSSAMPRRSSNRCRRPA